MKGPTFCSIGHGISRLPLWICLDSYRAMSPRKEHRYGDEEEFEAEEEERKRRMDLDKLFLSFARKIEEADKESHARVDVPFRDLGFNGVPARSSVWVQPSTDCLIQITEPPFLVLTLDDIEVVHLERVQVCSTIFAHHGLQRLR